MSTSKRKQKIARRETNQARKTGLIIGVSTLILLIILYLAFQNS